MTCGVLSMTALAARTGFLMRRTPATAPALSPAPSMRSEERRVGKECRYRCDWSSDVCSSDLHDVRCSLHDGPCGEDRVLDAAHAGDRAGPEPGTLHEIGRASCRERV